MIRLATTREEEGGSEVPVPRRVSWEEDVRLKKRAGTEPHITGAINVATVVPLG